MLDSGNISSLALEQMVLAALNKPMAVVEAPHWASNVRDSMKEAFQEQFQRDLHHRDVLRQGSPGGYRYFPGSASGLPRLELDAPAEYSRVRHPDGKVQIIPARLHLAGSACYKLDIEAGTLGAWGAECKVEKILQMPKGKLERNSDLRPFHGDYLYTPPSKNSVDSVRFILSNGADKRVDVTMRLRAQSYRSSLTPDSDLAMDESMESAALSAAALQVNRLTPLAYALTELTVNFAALEGSALGSTVGDIKGVRVELIFPIAARTVIAYRSRNMPST